MQPISMSAQERLVRLYRFMSRGPDVETHTHTRKKW